MQDLDRLPGSNRRPILESMSDYYVIDICTSDLCPVFKFSNLWSFLKSTYTLTITNKSAIDLRIWKWPWFEIRTSVSIWGVDTDLNLSCMQKIVLFELTGSVYCPFTTNEFVGNALEISWSSKYMIGLGYWYLMTLWTILWQSVLFLKDTLVPRDNYRPATCHWVSVV